MAEFLPAGVFNVVLGDRETGAALVAHPIPQMVSITGSVRAGMQVAAAAAADVKRVHLELGGKAPVVDLRRRRPREGGRGDRGRRLLQRRPGLHGGDPGAGLAAASTKSSSAAWSSRPRARPPARRDEDVLYGPLNNANQLSHVTGFVERTPDHAKVVTGGHRARDKGYFFEPTVIDGLAAG